MSEAVKMMNVRKCLLLAVVFLIAGAGCGPSKAAVTPTLAPPQAPEDAGPTPGRTTPLAIEEGKLYVAIIWHQHQPFYYRDPATGIYERPWVRLHATKDYVDMAAMLEDYPRIHATFNLTPSLIEQLDAIAAGAEDQYLVHAKIPAENLIDEQKQFLLDRFFDVNPSIIARFPRYAELSTMRSEDSLQTWSVQDFRDLQVLFNLAWFDPDWLALEPLAGLVAKGKDYAEADKAVVFAEQLRRVQEVIPLHAELQRSGQIEITTTPYAHPILPLLVDSNLASMGLPEAELPTRFVYGQERDAFVRYDNAEIDDRVGVQVADPDVPAGVAPPTKKRRPLPMIPASACVPAAGEKSEARTPTAI
ncbi:MAG: hypothetical protein ACK2T2_06575 [Anaerolineales bacterium]